MTELTKISFNAGSGIYDPAASFIKTISLGTEFQYTSEPSVQYIDPRDTRLVKYASAESLDFIRTVAPRPGHTTVLVLAMGASDFYGGNRNGDGFASRPVYIRGRKELDWHETLPQHYKSFETVAHNFVHHANQDPSKSVGSVRRAFYNDRMQRVELLLDVNESNSKVRSFIDKIRDRDYPAVSMGCRIKYDICDTCGNRAPTRRQYCEHANGRNPSYGLGKIMGNGDYCIVWNPSPNLFDISWVFTPADRMGYTLKVAGDANDSVYTVKTSAVEDEAYSVYVPLIKSSTIQKISDIEKIIQGVIGGIVDGDDDDRPPIGIDREHAPYSEELVNECSKHPISVVLKSLVSVGMVPSLIDVYRIVCKKNDEPPSFKIAKNLFKVRRRLLEYACNDPGLMDEVTKYAGLDEFTLSNASANETLTKLAYEESTEKTSALQDTFIRRTFNREQGGSAIANMMGSDAYTANTNKMYYARDPATNRIKSTSRRDIDNAEVENFKRRSKVVGAAAGAAGAGVLGVLGLGALTRNKYIAALSIPAALAGAYGTYRTAKSDEFKAPTTRTLSGRVIPRNTVFSEKLGEESTSCLFPTELITHVLSADAILEHQLTSESSAATNKVAGERLSEEQTFDSYEIPTGLISVLEKLENLFD